MGGWVRPHGWADCSAEKKVLARTKKNDWEYSPSEKGPHYRDLYPEPPPPGSVPSCAEGGVLGILPGVIGCIQANECIKILLGIGETLSGRILSYDALNMRFREFKLRRDPQTKPITELIDYQRFCGADSAEKKSEGFERISLRNAHIRVQEGWNPFILDVRTSAEAKIVSLEDTDLLHPHRSVADIASFLPKDRDILVYCKLGGRSSTSCSILAELGFSRLFNLEGGIVGWAKEIDPTLPIY
jgi:adenylyltransferase/sulfurtransferase